MLQIETQANWNCPKFFCASCRREIASATSAVAVFPNFAEFGSRFAPLFVHKNFVHGDCMALAEHQLKEQGHVPGWEEMTTLLAHAIANVGMDSDSIRDVLCRPNH